MGARKEAGGPEVPVGVFTLLASGSCSPEGTDAAEAVDLVHAGGPVGAGRRLALVYVCKGNRGMVSKSDPRKTHR